MIRWMRIHHGVETDADPWHFEAEVGHLLLTVEQSDDYRSWAWSVGIVGGDGAELAQGSCVSEYLAKSAARRCVVGLVAKVESALRAPYRRRA